MDLISLATSTSLVASVGSAVQTTGTNLWVIVAVAVAIPLTFYVIHRIIGLFPSTRGRKA